MAAAQVGTLVTFTTGTTIVAADVNQNFADIKAAFNTLVTATDTLASGLTIPSPTLSGTAAVSATATFSHATGVTTNTVTERTAGSGVTADGTLLKDGGATITGTLTLTGATVVGQPTWASTQAVNISGSSASTTGNAATATALATARTINGVSFDGSANITVTAAAGTLTGTTLNSSVVSSSLTSVGTLTSLTVSGVATFSHATGVTTNTLTERTLGSGVTVDGTLIKDGTVTAALAGNASTATKLETARTINGVSFDGTANITVAAAAGTLTGSTLASGVTASSLTSVGTLTALTIAGNGNVVRVLDTGGTASLTDDTVENDAVSYTVPADTVSTDLMKIRFSAWGESGATARSVTVRVYFGGSLIHEHSATTGGNNPWRLDVELTRLGASSQNFFSEIKIGASNASGVREAETATTALSFASSQIFKCTLQQDGTSGGITVLGHVFELLPAS